LKAVCEISLVHSQYKLLKYIKYIMWRRDCQVVSVY
jgi:hypothetical protein